MKKRKEFRHDFRSISPPPKSRRLEWECEVLSTIMEEEENAMVKPCVDPTSTKPASEDRALVLYDSTATTPFLRSPTSPQFSIVVKADLIPGLKDYLLSWGIKRDGLGEDEIRREKSSEVSNDCLAVVPWVSFHAPMACEEIVEETGQPLEVEESGDMMEMD